MALFQTDFYSNSLVRTVSFNILIPNDINPAWIIGNVCYSRKMKTLYLLHGYTGSCINWLNGSLIQELSEKYNLAVVMPSGENSFYLDGKGTGKAYCQFVGKELVSYIKKTFGLSDKKEDNFIGGMSMGGFGAIHTGLAFPETFGKVISLSAALIIHDIENMKEGDKNETADYDYYTSVFGDLGQLNHSINNPEYLIQKLNEEKQTIPAIYMTCGTEDSLLDANMDFYDFLLKNNVDVKFVEGPGVHDYKFWNSQLEPAIQWLLL